MEDLCFAQIARAACQAGAACPDAHTLDQLANPDCWVTFPSHRGINVMSFIADKYRRHQAFRHYHIPRLGSLLRLPTSSEAKVVVETYRESLGAVTLLEFLKGAGAVAESDSQPSSPVDRHDAHPPASATPPDPRTLLTKENLAILEVLTPEQRTMHHSQQVLEILQKHAGGPDPVRVGWLALDAVWGIRENDFDDAALMYLRSKTPAQQQHILLTFAAIGLTAVQNLSAYLSCLIREHDTTPQVCIRFFAGVCHDQSCDYVHPQGTVGWNLLEELWGLTYRDFDYAALNYLSKKPATVQDNILTTFAAMNLKSVNNLSAYLSSVVQKFETKDKDPSRWRHPQPSQAWDGKPSLPMGAAFSSLPASFSPIPFLGAGALWDPWVMKLVSAMP